METAASCRGPWKHGRRCIVVANGFYEWQVKDDEIRQPYFICLKDRDVFGFAALWDNSITDDGVIVESCAIITIDASPFMAEIHNDKKRMPTIIARFDYEAWLQGSAQEARAVLRQFSDDALVAWPVSRAVNSPKTNSPELIEPVNNIF